MDLSFIFNLFYYPFQGFGYLGIMNISIVSYNVMRMINKHNPVGYLFGLFTNRFIRITFHASRQILQMYNYKMVFFNFYLITIIILYITISIKFRKKKKDYLILINNINYFTCKHDIIHNN